MSKCFVQFILASLTLLLCSSCANRIDSAATLGIAKFALGKDRPLHYVETGKGSPVLLIPGLFGTHKVWNRMIPQLADHYRLLAIDNFGTGLSGEPDYGFVYGVAEQADKIVAMLDDLKIARIDLVGVSYGGMIALNLAARYPQRIGAVVCIEGGVIMPKNRPYRRLIQGLEMPILGDMIIGFIRSGLFDQTMAKDIMGHSWNDLEPNEQAEITEIITHNAGVASRVRWLGLARALNNAEDFSEEAKAITAPVLYLSGDKSAFREMTAMNIEFFKNHLPQVELFSFENGIHDLELQKPRETAKLILAFMGRKSTESILSAASLVSD